MKLLVLMIGLVLLWGCEDVTDKHFDACIEECNPGAYGISPVLVYFIDDNGTPHSFECSCIDNYGSNEG